MIYFCIKRFRELHYKLLLELQNVRNWSDIKTIKFNFYKGILPGTDIIHILFVFKFSTGIF